MEELIGAIITILDAHMAAELAAITAAKTTEDTAIYGGPLNLDDIREYCFGDRGQPNDAPFVLVIGESETPDGWINERESYAVKVVYKFDIRLFIWGDDEERINKRIIRYAKALKNVLSEHYDLGGLSLGGGIGDISYSPLIKIDGLSGFYRGISIDFTAIKISRD